MLKGKTAIVTGSNRGIGREIVEVFAENGADIFACARNASCEFEEDMKKLSDKNNCNIYTVYFDLSDSNTIKKAVMDIRSKHKKIDILINNAGILSEYQRFLMMPMERVRNLFEIDYFSQMEFTQMVARNMQKNKEGSIVFISSIASIDAFFSSFDYGACKAAINLSVKQLSREMGEVGIRVNAVAPGVIETEMIKDVNKKSKESLLPAISLKRYGNKRDVANAVLFLASEMSLYITGQVLRVDGGIAPPRATW